MIQREICEVYYERNSILISVCIVLPYRTFQQDCKHTHTYIWIYTYMHMLHCVYIEYAPKAMLFNSLTHWGRATHKCSSKLTIIGPDNGLSPGRRQAIIWTIAGILLIGPLGTNFNEILIGIQAFSFKKMHLKMSAKWRPFVLASMC